MEVEVEKAAAQGDEGWYEAATDCLGSERTTSPDA